jgi:phage FluMu gp28-like protein
MTTAVMVEEKNGRSGSGRNRTGDGYFLPYQERWIWDDAQMKLYEKSRRIGITYATSYRAVRKCATRANLTQWVSSRDQLTAREFITDYVSLWARALKKVVEGLDGRQVVIDEEKGITAYEARFANGSRIVSLSSNPHAFAGKGGDVLLDEADLHPDPKLLIDMALPCTTWGGQLEIVSAYDAGGSENSTFAQLVKDAKGANPMGWSFHRTTIEDAVREGFVKAVNRRTGGNDTDAEFVSKLRARCRTEDAWNSQYLCIPAVGQGSLLPYELICASEVRNCEQPPPYEHKTYVGMDIGRKRDLSVIWVVEPVGDIWWTRAVDVLEKCPFHAQLDRLLQVCAESGARRCCIDATGIGAMLAEEAQRKARGTRIEAIQFTAPVKEDLAMLMLRRFQDRAVRIPAGREVREDLHKVEKQVTAAGNIRYDATRDEEGHADRFWALALALHAGDTSGSSLVDGLTLTGMKPARRDPNRPDHSDDYERRNGRSWRGF